ncbi:MAG: SCP2 sterol-binding domain-containing protein [Halioglobus sp.]
MPSAINPTLHTAALATLETGINRALQLAPQAKKELAELQDCVFKLECTAPEIDLYLEAGGRGIRLMGIYEGEITTTVRGKASDFTELAASADPAASLINGKLAIDGDSAPLIELQQIIGKLDMDWEAPLVNTLGDVAGHQLAQILRGAFSWGQHASDSLLRQLEEFIHEEARLSPPRLELEDFYRDIQELSLRTERLQSRTDRLQKRMQQRNS